LTLYNFDGLKDIVLNLTSKPVYLTIDLDVLDPSVFPGTGTPEAGGVSFHDLIDALKTVSILNIVGADIVELSPHYDHSGVSTAVACKVLRELIMAVLCKK
jgi:agmatinase